MLISCIAGVRAVPEARPTVPLGYPGSAALRGRRPFSGHCGGRRIVRTPLEVDPSALHQRSQPSCPRYGARAPPALLVVDGFPFSLLSRSV